MGSEMCIRDSAIPIAKKRISRKYFRKSYLLLDQSIRSSLFSCFSDALKRPKKKNTAREIIVRSKKKIFVSDTLSASEFCKQSKHFQVKPNQGDH